MNAEIPKTIFVKTAVCIQMAYCNEPLSAFIGVYRRFRNGLEFDFLLLRSP